MIFYIEFVHVAMECVLDSLCFVVKTEDCLRGVRVSHEESICCGRRFSGVKAGRVMTRISGCAWIKSLFCSLGVDNADFASPDDEVIEVDGVRDALVLEPCNHWCSANMTIEESCCEPDGVLAA